MKKTIFILLAANLILMGCTSRKIDISEIDKNIPTNYELFNFYYENLDSDSEKEIIVLLQQKRSYVTNDEEFKSLPVIIKVLDSNNGLWIASQDRMIKKKIRYFSNYFPTKETGAPYRIFKNWIILKSQNRSFHGAADTVDIFSYDNDLGLFLIRFGTDGSADYALTSLIDKKDIK